MAAKERIKRARITHISLCPKGKNRLRATFHAAVEGTAAFELSALACMDEQGLLTACIYLPESAGLPDSTGRVFDDAGLIECAHNWLTECIAGRGGVDLRHDFRALPPEAVQICESFMIQRGDPRFASLQCEGKPVNATGGWGAVFKIHDAQLREKYRKGEWEAVSMAGLAEVEPIAMENNLSTLTMDQETKTLLTGLATDLKAVVDALKTKPTPITNEQKPAVVKIEFEGDPTDAKALAAHEEKLVLASCDLSTPEGIAKWRKYLASKNPKPDAKPDDAGPGKTKPFQFAAALDDDNGLLEAGKQAVARLNGGK